MYTGHFIISLFICALLREEYCNSSNRSASSLLITAWQSSLHIEAVILGLRK